MPVMRGNGVKRLIMKNDVAYHSSNGIFGPKEMRTRLFIATCGSLFQCHV